MHRSRTFLFILQTSKRIRTRIIFFSIDAPARPILLRFRQIAIEKNRKNLLYRLDIT